MLDIGIIGASGYTGGELMRLLLNHPQAKVELATSRKLVGQKVSATHRHLKDMIDLQFENPAPQEIKDRCDVVFVAVPHGTAMGIVPQLLDDKVKVIDLSADYRLKTDVFEKVYGIKHLDPRNVVYGIPELHPEVKHQKFIANPGCFPTGASLAAAPLAQVSMIESVVFDSKTGVSGAGIEPSLASHYPNMAENVQPYKLTTHRHLAEFTQELQRLDNSLTKISFTPHIIPSVRGILTTTHIFTKGNLTKYDVMDLYAEMYQDKPFVRVVDGVPSISAVRGSNFCDIGFEVDSRNNRVVVISAIDNLVKGASGQAIQNMNIMCGLGETTGLWMSGVAP
ncbi:N-acetyl-gamma-glutamyl-phosphate reductase [uncultured Methanomethylovorans sp.]|uniref:N-acetyl-gamma-glutamyl-phosphate reductase n=1 Tax=uncultured Methanomethylovorans sp. TaxID=183759 RepID=UPI002AA854F6|nr:N-acetyl-gamma-glutamyl-phosphate reductase [uncultured Methanomethylovorans sp.]